MPTVGVTASELYKLMGRTMTENQFRDLCFAFGIELDSVTSEQEMQSKGEKGTSSSTAASTETIYKIEVAANRYDLLCVEGIARALRIFLGDMEPPPYSTTPPILTMNVAPEVLPVRPFVVCGVLRNFHFTDSTYRSFIDLQDKLHQTVCKERSLVSIGTHDLDTVKPPFRYTALPPEKIVFVPLKCSTPMNGHQLMEHLSKDLKLGKYLDLIRHKPVYPVIYDSNDVVLSLPPIINGEHSKITLNTKNVFIEVTATDFTKANIVLNMVVTMFSQYCEPQWKTEQVTVVSQGKSVIAPDLTERPQNASVSSINRSLGLQLSPVEMLKLLKRMGIYGQPSQSADSIVVNVPASRSDILHECDVLEDVAIAYGYNNLKTNLTPSPTIGSQLQLTKIADLLTQEIAMAGYCEVMNFALCTVADNFKNLQRPDDGSAIRIKESKTQDFESGRTTLLSGLLRTVASNKSAALPIRIFEIGDTILRDTSKPVGARNQKNVAALYCGTTSGVQFIHGLIDRVMFLLNIVPKSSPTNAPVRYYLQPSEDPAFFPQWRSDIFINGKKVGSMGVIHPQVLAEFKVDYPCAAFEMSLEVPNNL